MLKYFSKKDVENTCNTFAVWVHEHFSYLQVLTSEW